ncbi:Hypp4672 [Branchiostoma lanceolatum]|uniref:Hypp4672 protein n=1 Tax=Branchiostoma lanceolatum TaxID=7740 RepID=A0A8K0A901_BRALA|nr:Hypp4672 [Branchiostoma lanceolatum]
MKAKMKTCIQPNCDKVFYHRTKMLKHLEDDHDLILSSSTHRFDTEREFLDWKENEEKDNLVQFTKQRGDKLTKGGRYIYYICEHDGSDKPHCARGQPARLSSRRSRKGRVKTGSICPARMLVKSELNSSVMRVTYISTHNHEPRPCIKSSRRRRTCSRTTPRRKRTSQGKVAPDGIELQASNLPTSHTGDNNAAFLIEVDLDNEDMDTDFEDPQSEVLMREEIKGYLARLTELMEDERVQRIMLPRVHDVLKETVAQCEAMTAQPASTVVQLIHPEPLGQPFPGQREHDYICI